MQNKLFAIELFAVATLSTRCDLIADCITETPNCLSLRTLSSRQISNGNHIRLRAAINQDQPNKFTVQDI